MWLFFFWGGGFVTQYNLSVSSFVPNFRILSQVVAEKSLTEKSLQTDKQTEKQTNIITKKAKTVYPIYTSYRARGMIKEVLILFLDNYCCFNTSIYHINKKK